MSSDTVAIPWQGFLDAIQEVDVRTEVYCVHGAAEGTYHKIAIKYYSETHPHCQNCFSKNMCGSVKV